MNLRLQIRELLFSDTADGLPIIATVRAKRGGDDSPCFVDLRFRLTAVPAPADCAAAELRALEAARSLLNESAVLRLLQEQRLPD